jgi:hypothetical protein
VSRQDYQSIYIRETPDGPEVVFDGGVQAWAIPNTDRGLDVLERALARRRWEREDKAQFEAMTPEEVERAQGLRP